MTTFRGLLDYRTKDAALLRQDLQRQNAALAKAFDELGTPDGRPVPRSAEPRDYPDGTDAKHGELVAAGTNVTVRLPKSAPESAGKYVKVAMAGGGSVFVAANQSQRNADGSFDTVAGIATYTMSTPGQAMTFVDQGDGRWWRS